MAATWQSDRKSAPVNSLRVCVLSTHTLDCCQRGAHRKCFSPSLSLSLPHKLCVYVKVCVCFCHPLSVLTCPLDSCRPPGQRGTTCPSRNQHTHAHKHKLCPTLPYPYLPMVSAFHHGLLNGIGDTHTQASLRFENILSYFSYWPKSTFINSIKAP